LHSSPKYRSGAVTLTAGLKAGGLAIFFLVPNPIQFWKLALEANSLYPMRAKPTTHEPKASVGHSG